MLSYLHPIRGHNSIFIWLQQSDHIFNMGVEVMRPAFNFEPKCRVHLLTREEWTKGTGAPPVVKELVWYTDGSKKREGLRLESMGNLGRRLSFSLGKYATFFQAAVYVILVCVYVIRFQNRSEK